MWRAVDQSRITLKNKIFIKLCLFFGCRKTWHEVLKSGCRVEDSLLETAERLKRYPPSSASSACV
jgi:hypothetical protein